MRQTELFTKTRREDPADEVSKNAKLLIRAGYIHKEMAGVYSFLPLGLRVLEKIKTIVREEMNAVSGQEILMTALQEKELWEKTDRWDDAKVDIWFKTKLKNGTELGLGMSHEEPLVQIMKDHIKSYRDLPVSAYQFQTKFRNELRPKSGIMRGREFLMKDMYSFHSEQSELDTYYEKVEAAYERVYKRVGLGDYTFKTFASGGIFTKYSHEYQTLSEAGEDTIYISREKNLAINEEVYTDEVLAELGLERSELEMAKSIEVGNIFKLSTRYSEPLGLVYLDEAGKSYPVVMGCYGLGISRLMGTVVEVLADAGGLVWPKAIAPFSFHLVSLGNSAEVIKGAEELYKELAEQKIDVLFDNRDLSAGEKLADADLLGVPYRIIVSDKTLANGKFEVKDRRSGEVSFMTASEITALV
ncbi:MAG: prolyl-tRNA synthetase [Patescibacteria group bacterium]|nr:prolyl-tRNA synthetase [Patescibacteria group bacterium]